MGFTDQAGLAKDAVFRDRVRVAVVKAAVSVIAEPPSAIGAVDEMRARLATEILKDGGASYLEAFAWGVAQSAAVTAQSSDNDIEFTVNSIFSGVAGVPGKYR